MVHPRPIKGASQDVINEHMLSAIDSTKLSIELSSAAFRDFITTYKLDRLDTEQRVRWLERYMNYAIGVFGLVALAVSVIRLVMPK